MQGRAEGRWGRLQGAGYGISDGGREEGDYRRQGVQGRGDRRGARTGDGGEDRGQIMQGRGGWEIVVGRKGQVYRKKEERNRGFSKERKSRCEGHVGVSGEG
ncbi:hypothetical protein Pcinc_038041 [Petrolisthes cinctipes]|uniref:Uncharacterized protein n=1 Tax=Petrolisthes cinctipes TaxID=88211 RepID=A0AAE1BUS7_PETCI|nr:hypothetical protein Pcinc_038041 [Petrolisthes cinctipes]